MKKAFICIITLILLSCNKKEKTVTVPEHVGGSLYVNRKVSQSEYAKMMQKREFDEKEKHKKMIERENFYKKQREEWNANYRQPEPGIIRSNIIEINEIDIKAESQKPIEIKPQKQIETKPQKKIVYEAKGIKIYESN